MEKYDEQYLEVDQCINQSNSMKDSLACYEYLYELKFRVPKEIYAFYFRKLLNMNTGNISNEPRWKMFEGVDPEDIMYQDELDAINNEFKDCITVYRGASKVEDVPGVCWIRYKWVVEHTFYRGRLFEAKISKTSILLYLAHDADEGEVNAYVISDYKIIKED